MLNIEQIEGKLSRAKVAVKKNFLYGQESLKKVLLKKSKKTKMIEA